MNASRFASFASLPLVLALTIGCSASGKGGSEFDATSSTGSGAGSGSASDGAGGGSSSTGILSGSGTGGGSTSSGLPDCSDQTGAIYTLDADNSLYRFDPPTLDFTLIGVLDCPSVAASPYSMAVARDGTAWTVFTDGTLYKVDTTNAHCTSTSFVPGQSGWTTFGMGFSTDTPGGTSETLYISEAKYDASVTTTKGLGKIDLQTMTLTPIGMYDKVDARAELTGSGDARLFGAFEGTPYDLVEIDKGSAQIKSQAPQNSINYPPDTSNFAFAFWGGDFYLFVGPGTSTDVFHYKPSDGTTTKVKSVSYEIVGAGVSTCAPLTMPK